MTTCNAIVCVCVCVCENIKCISMSFKRLHLTQSTERDAYKTCPFMHTHSFRCICIDKNKRTFESLKNENFAWMISLLRANSYYNKHSHIHTHTHIYRRLQFQFWNRFCLHFFLLLLFSFVPWCASAAVCCRVFHAAVVVVVAILLLLAACLVPIQHHKPHICVRSQSMADIEVERCGLLFIRDWEKLLRRILPRGLYISRTFRIVFICECGICLRFYRRSHVRWQLARAPSYFTFFP